MTVKENGKAVVEIVRIDALKDVPDYLSAYSPTHLPAYLPVYLPAYLPIRMSIYISNWNIPIETSRLAYPARRLGRAP